MTTNEASTFTTVSSIEPASPSRATSSMPWRTLGSEISSLKLQRSERSVLPSRAASRSGVPITSHLPRIRAREPSSNTPRSLVPFTNRAGPGSQASSVALPEGRRYVDTDHEPYASGPELMVGALYGYRWWRLGPSGELFSPWRGPYAWQPGL